MFQRLVQFFISFLNSSSDSNALLLIEKLQDDNETIRRTASAELIKLGTQAVKPLVDALQDKKRTVRRTAALALGEIGDKRAVKPLIEGLIYWSSRSSLARDVAVEALRKIGAPTVGPLITVLKDKDSSAASAAATALGLTYNTRAIEPLITALNKGDKIVQMTAAEALGRIGNDRAINALIAAQGQGDWDVRAAVATALKLHSAGQSIRK